MTRAPTPPYAGEACQTGFPLLVGYYVGCHPRHAEGRYRKRAPVSRIRPRSGPGHIFDVKCATVAHRPFRYTASVTPTFLVSRLAVLTLLVSPLGRHWSRPTFRPALSPGSCGIGRRACGLSFFSFKRSSLLSSEKSL